MTLTSMRVRSWAASTLSIVIWQRPFPIGLEDSKSEKTGVCQSMITASLFLRRRNGPGLLDHQAGRAGQLIDHLLQVRSGKVVDVKPKLGGIGNKRRVHDHRGHRIPQKPGAIRRQARPGDDRTPDVGNAAEQAEHLLVLLGPAEFRKR